MNIELNGGPKAMSPEQISCVRSCSDGWASCIAIDIEGETATTDEIFLMNVLTFSSDALINAMGKQKMKSSALTLLSHWILQRI